MWKFIVLTIMLQSTHALPLEQTETPEVQLTTDNVEQFQQTGAVVSYIQNFKNIMAEYVNAQYKNLSINAMDEIKAALEVFLIHFANDLKDTIESQGKNMTLADREPIEDGLPDSTFEEIKTRMKNEFPDIQDDTADEIVFKLRKNLFVTRRKVDTIINSEKAGLYIEYGLD